MPKNRSLAASMRHINLCLQEPSSILCKTALPSWGYRYPSGCDTFLRFSKRGECTLKLDNGSTRLDVDSSEIYQAQLLASCKAERRDRQRRPKRRNLARKSDSPGCRPRFESRGY